MNSILLCYIYSQTTACGYKHCTVYQYQLQLLLKLKVPGQLATRKPIYWTIVYSSISPSLIVRSISIYNLLTLLYTTLTIQIYIEYFYIQIPHLLACTLTYHMYCDSAVICALPHLSCISLFALLCSNTNRDIHDKCSYYSVCFTLFVLLCLFHTAVIRTELCL